MKLTTAFFSIALLVSTTLAAATDIKPIIVTGKPETGAPAKPKKRPRTLTADEVVSTLVGTWKGSGTDEVWTITAQGYDITMVSTGTAAVRDPETKRLDVFSYRQTLTTHIEPNPYVVWDNAKYLVFTETAFEPAAKKWYISPMLCGMELDATRDQVEAPTLNGLCQVPGVKDPIAWRVQWWGRKAAPKNALAAAP